MYLDKISRFITYFTEQYDLINQIGNTHKYKIHKKALYCSLIDALSGVVYPTKGNRDRFVSIIIEFGEWIFAERISIPHITRLLELNPAPAYSNLRKYIFGIFEQWRFGELVTLDRDVSIEEVARLWPKGKDNFQPIEGISIDSLKHAHLLYTYRNSLIHDFRPLGSDIEVTEDENPYYLLITGSENEQDHWNLIYPTPFFQKLSNSILNNIETYFKENRIDPIEVIRRGKFWLNGLNK
jgi:hypothetical protein